jgi:hypothetical protein
MNVEIGTEAAIFPEKEYINGIFLAVYAIFIFHWVRKNGLFLLLCILSMQIHIINGFEWPYSKIV